jgi:hypothetical protein
VPEFLRQFTQGVIDPITRDSEIWQSLSTDRSLWVWIYCASRADEISDKVGVSEQLFDHSFFELEGEAFLFLNDLLRRFQSFDRNTTRGAADALWDEIASGTETYEVGDALYTLELGTCTWS